MSQAGLGPAGRSLSRPLSVRAVLFDLDGTLVDSAPDLTVATNKMLSALGYPHVNCTQVKGWVGDGARSLVMRALTANFGNVPAESLIEQSYVLFQRYYAQSVYQDSTLYPCARMEGDDEQRSSGVSRSSDGGTGARSGSA